MPGVKSVYVAAPAGTEMQYQGWEIAGVAATTEEIAGKPPADQGRYEVLPHYVKGRRFGQRRAKRQAGR